MGARCAGRAARPRPRAPLPRCRRDVPEGRRAGGRGIPALARGPGRRRPRCSPGGVRGPLPRREDGQRHRGRSRRRDPSLRRPGAGHIGCAGRGAGRRQAGDRHRVPSRRRTARRGDRAGGAPRRPGGHGRGVAPGPDRAGPGRPHERPGGCPGTPAPLAGGGRAVPETGRRAARSAGQRSGVTAPEPPFEHLLRLSDDTGLFEHARGAVPRRDCGYCVDDVARGLVVASRQPSPVPAVMALGERWLAFLNHAQVAGGSCHNRLGFDRRWEDEAGVGDWWGRSLWGSGTAAARGWSARLRADALAHFDVGVARRSPSPRAMAFAALGAAEVLSVRPHHQGARHLLEDAAALLRPARQGNPHTRPSGEAAWPWPEPRLRYANAAWAEALMAAGWALGDDHLVDEGISLLDWLLATETVEGHLSLTAVGGWAPGEARPGFDQQPIEAASLADASARAFVLTGDGRFVAGVSRAVSWCLGVHVAQTPM